MNKKVYICCPGGSITGGPELLHQFCDALGRNGVDASMVYYPLDTSFQLPQQYAHYNVRVTQHKDVVCDNAIVIIPEVATALAKNFSAAQICIWWLSVDNYFSHKKYNWFIRRYVGHFKSILTGHRLSISSMKNYQHLSQSEYARMFLESRGIHCDMLTDYLNETHLKDIDESIKRENIIAYNPKKGEKYSNKLISRYPDYKFIPIKNMTAIEVRKLLERSKVYIDFGDHPGKDRFPREAVMAGCCVVTGRRGSAANKVDVPVPSCYKLDESAESFEQDFQKIIENIFQDYEKCYADFESYKNKISSEFDVFKQQVKLFSVKYCNAGSELDIHSRPIN
ncbi:hypothetical protein J9788_10600 [Serratia sp. X10]|uniref:hypothetical protein n=1 Tax=Serratia TaxID=613 RepID=UPI0015F71588|nr:MULTISPECIES: hypothetical protein [unclassified Serratia (in: enterobacteria)]MBE4973824.1 hypothetical protein [Serratia sp. X3]MCH6193095.1 hypothetical protein [Serratia sp. X10]